MLLMPDMWLALLEVEAVGCCMTAASAAAAAAAAALAGREVVVDPASDEFYRSHKFANYGEVGLSVKELVDKFSSQSAAHKQVRLLGMHISIMWCAVVSIT
jgi:hypothetical protein